ncbi:hypothetical protein K0504_09820 [Neiella marina]|uniref:Uncharacterized protein n=1 Tax=Neiella holothuriorum TaxID=2870530 RepID=A0ABS7EG70_9GAMM|nr:hypothetical protein [Neiella holothuriorum]MBW8191334.1 hypothetical protein [Neiella holothuriorum]
MVMLRKVLMSRKSRSREQLYAITMQQENYGNSLLVETASGSANSRLKKGAKKQQRRRLQAEAAVESLIGEKTAQGYELIEDYAPTQGPKSLSQVVLAQHSAVEYDMTDVLFGSFDRHSITPLPKGVRLVVDADLHRASVEARTQTGQRFDLPKKITDQLLSCLKPIQLESVFIDAVFSRDTLCVIDLMVANSVNATMNKLQRDAFLSEYIQGVDKITLLPSLTQQAAVQYLTEGGIVASVLSPVSLLISENAAGYCQGEQPAQSPKYWRLDWASTVNMVVLKICGDLVQLGCKDGNGRMNAIALLPSHGASYQLFDVVSVAVNIADGKIEDYMQICGVNNIDAEECSLPEHQVNLECVSDINQPLDNDAAENWSDW